MSNVILHFNLAYNNHFLVALVLQHSRHFCKILAYHKTARYLQVMHDLCKMASFLARNLVQPSCKVERILAQISARYSARYTATRALSMQESCNVLLPVFVQPYLQEPCKVWSTIVQESCSALLPDILAILLARSIQDLKYDFSEIPARHARKWPYYLQGCRKLAGHTRLCAR